MKKFLILILAVLLTGCVDENVIQVERTQNGYTSKLIATIEREDAEGMDFYYCDQKAFCVTRWYEEGENETLKVDLETSEIQKLVMDVNESNDERVLFENEQYKIILFDRFEKVAENTYDTVYKKYYYEEDGKRHILYEGYENIDDSIQYSYISTFINYETNELLFFIKEENVISVKKIENGKLVELYSQPIYLGEYSLTDFYKKSSGVVWRYENDDNIKIISNGQEDLYEKELEDNLKLVEFHISAIKPVLKYENDKKILYKYFENNEEIEILKEIDGYSLKEYRFDKQNVFTYTKSEDVRLVIDGENYDLSNPAKYILTNDVIIYTTRNIDKKEYETYYIDLNTNNEYLLSEAIEMSEVFNFNDKFIVRSYGNSELYSILKFDGLNCKLIELPFTWEFYPQNIIDNDTIIFSYKTKDMISFYSIEVK